MSNGLSEKERDELHGWTKYGINKNQTHTFCPICKELIILTEDVPHKHECKESLSLFNHKE